jgi:short-subunit dehydrogenase
MSWSKGLILVCNAGHGLYGEFVDQPLQKTLDMLQVNLMALTELTHIFASDMKRRRAGHILLIASLLGYQAVPGYAAYAASKGYVLLFGEALHSELKSFGVSVTVLCPGATATSFGAVAGQRNTAALRMLMMEPQPVATTGILAMLRRKTSVVAGIFNKAVVFSHRLTPRPLQSLVMRKVMSG